MICTSQFKHKKNSKRNKDRFHWALKRFCFVFKVSRNRPPSVDVDVDHGYCGRGGRGVVTRTALSVSGKTNAGVAVSAAQSADVVACEGGGGGFAGSVCLLPGSPLSARFRIRIFSSPVFSNVLSKQRQLLRFAAVSSQISVLMSRAFMSRSQISLYLSWGCAWGLLPKASWSLKMSLGIWPSSSAVRIVWVLCIL